MANFHSYTVLNYFPPPRLPHVSKYTSFSGTALYILEKKPLKVKILLRKKKERKKKHNQTVSPAQSLSQSVVHLG